MKMLISFVTVLSCKCRSIQACHKKGVNYSEFQSLKYYIIHKTCSEANAHALLYKEIPNSAV
jgi:hypothetical protein